MIQGFNDVSKDSVSFCLSSLLSMKVAYLEVALPLVFKMAATAPEYPCYYVHAWQKIKHLCSSIPCTGPEGQSNWIG